MIDNIYLCLGSTAMRKNIALLAAVVKYQMYLSPFTTNLYIFCGKSKKVIKILEWSNDENDMNIFKKKERQIINE